MKLTRNSERAVLLGATLLGAALRLAAPGHSPPGLHVDAAANAWTTQCLLRTGTDWRGERWPVFYSRGFGESQTTLDYYLLLPFQALLGMSPETTRIPTVLAGILAIPLIAFLGGRWLGKPTGLLAALLLAVNPWHLHLSRTGHEAGLTPLLVLLPLAAMLWAGLPLSDDAPSPRIGRAALAGVVLGLACYGYFAVRLFLPLFLLAAVVLALPGWKRIRSRAGAMALGAFLAGALAIGGPLAARQVLDPAVAKRAHGMEVWSEGDREAVRVGKAALRYPIHFAPAFLFERGDTWPLHALPRSGAFPWYALPLLVAGLVAALFRARASLGARLLLAWVALYPLTDVLLRHDGVNSFRSSPGIAGLVLLAAFGAVSAVSFLRERAPRAAVPVLCGFVLLAVASDARFLKRFFVDYDRDRDVRLAFDADLLEASAWLRPRLDRYDAVFVTTEGGGALMQPFVLTLVGLDYDPARFLAEPHEVRSRPDTDLQVAYGKIRFLFEPKDLGAIHELEGNRTSELVAFVVRPGQLGLTDPVHVVRAPDGSELLWICERTL